MLVLSLMVGVLTLLLGFIRFGFLDNILSRPLLRGFITGVAFTIATEQLDHFFGFSLPGFMIVLKMFLSLDLHGYEKIIYIYHHFKEVSWISFGVGITSFSTLYLCSFFKKRIKDRPKLKWFGLFPDILVVVVIAIVISVLAHLDEKGVAILGSFEGGFRTPKLPK
jgi:MFS superfamily sulfate permease-like transporter